MIAFAVGALFQGCCPQSCDAKDLTETERSWIDDRADATADLAANYSTLETEVGPVGLPSTAPPYSGMVKIASDGYLTVYLLEYSGKQFLITLSTNQGGTGITQIE